MRVLIDVRHLTGATQTGIGRYTESLLNALFEIDQKNEYVLLSSGSYQPDLGKPSIHISIPNKLLNLRTLLVRHPPITWRVREPIDLIFLPNLNITTLPEDIPTVLTLHDLSWFFYPQFYSKKMQWWHTATRPHELIRKSRALIVPSLSTKRDVERVFNLPSEKIHVIAHGVSELFQPNMQASDHGVRSRFKLPKRFVVFVGTIEPRKNLLALIEGVREYREKTRDDLHLVIVGRWGWKSHRLRRRLWKRDARGWIHHLDRIEDKDIPAIYRSAEATIFPSIYEGFGLPVLESLASGTPLITSHTSSLPEVSGDAAIYIDPYNSRDITQALQGLLGSSTLQKQLRERGLERAQRFSWHKAASETLRVFESSAEH